MHFKYGSSDERIAYDINGEVLYCSKNEYNTFHVITYKDGSLFATSFDSNDVKLREDYELPLKIYQKGNFKDYDGECVIRNLNGAWLELEDGQISTFYIKGKDDPYVYLRTAYVPLADEDQADYDVLDDSYYPYFFTKKGVTDSIWYRANNQKNMFPINMPEGLSVSDIKAVIRPKNLAGYFTSSSDPYCYDCIAIQFNNGEVYFADQKETALGMDLTKHEAFSAVSGSVKEFFYYYRDGLYGGWRLCALMDDNVIYESNN